MKKTLLAAILLSGALLISCSKDTEPAGIEVPIEFQITDEADDTRGTPINPGNGGNQNMAAGSTFDVRCHQGTAAAATFTAYATVDASAKASLSPTQNWPTSTVDMKFFAVHPHQTTPSVVTSTNTTMTITDFTINSAFASQQDLLYSYASQSSVTKTAVPMLFRHALTRVTFQLKLTGTNSTFTNVYVSKVELGNALTKGTVVISNAPAVTSWTASTRATVSSGAIAIANAKRLDGLSSTGGDSSADFPGSGATDGYYNIFADNYKNNSFLMIPMTVAELDAAATKTSISVYLSVNGSERGPYLVSGLGAKGAWAYGKHINYKLTFDMSKESITLGGVTVAAWGAQTSYELPLN